MAFNMMWKPGPEAVAGMHEAGSTSPPALVIYLDPDSLAIMPPADPAEWPGFVRLLRQLRDGADQLAVLLDGRTIALGALGDDQGRRTTYHEGR